MSLFFWRTYDGEAYRQLKAHYEFGVRCGVLTHTYENDYHAHDNTSARHMYDPRVEKKSAPLPTQARVLPMIRSAELLRGGRELCIEHLGQRSLVSDA